jgi:hypothetical protein
MVPYFSRAYSMPDTVPGTPTARCPLGDDFAVLDGILVGGGALGGLLAEIKEGYALAVVYPAAGNLGGGGFMTIQLADGHKPPWKSRRQQWARCGLHMIVRLAGGAQCAASKIAMSTMRPGK